MPLLAGGALELPLGILAGEGRRRRLAVLGGGVVFILSLLAVAGARSFIVLLAAFTVFFPASGAFVSLTQAELMDARPDRQPQVDLNAAHEVSPPPFGIVGFCFVLAAS